MTDPQNVEDAHSSEGRRWAITRTSGRVGPVAILAYVASIVLANWAIRRYGFVPVGLGLVAPAGTYFAGATFVARDAVQLSLGRWWALVAILAGAILSWQTSPSLAVASGTAFLVGEMADWLVFTPLRQRDLVAGFLAGNMVGLLFDTFLFLYLAFGSITHWQGTALGKLWMTVAALPAIWLVRRRYLNNKLPRRCSNPRCHLTNSPCHSGPCFTEATHCPHYQASL